MVAVYTLIQSYEFTFQHLWWFCFMSLGYPLSPFCFYFAHNLHGLNSTPMKIVRQQLMLPNEFLY